MVLRGNVTRFTGYLNRSPDMLYPEDTGVVNQLTNPRYTRVNVRKIKGNPMRTPTPISKSQAQAVTTRSAAIAARIRR